MKVDAEVSEATWTLVRLVHLELTSWEVIMRQRSNPPSWGKTLDLLLAGADLLPIPLDPMDIQRIDFIQKTLGRQADPQPEAAPPPPEFPTPPLTPPPLPAPQEPPLPHLPPAPLQPSPLPSPPPALAVEGFAGSAPVRADDATVVRNLRRLVFTDKLMTVEQAYRYCDAAGIPRSRLAEESERDS